MQKNIDNKKYVYVHRITAENFFYNKLTNILEVNGNVKYLDDSNDIIITSDKAIYFKNKEKISNHFDFLVCGTYL